LSGPLDLVTGQDVGLPVYPPENVDPPTYLVWVPEESQRHYVNAQTGFLWASDEKSVFFIDKTRGQQLLVRVDLEEGLRQPRITTRPIDVTLALANDPQDSERSPFLAVTGMELEPDGRIRLELDRSLFEQKKYRVSHLTISPPEFAPPIQEQPEEQQ
jgi:hypothetical protein